MSVVLFYATWERGCDNRRYLQCQDLARVLHVLKGVVGANTLHCIALTRGAPLPLHFLRKLKDSILLDGGACSRILA